MLGVNTNTVLRSLRLLREEGLLEFRRGRGISVAGTLERGAVVQRAKELVQFARSQGYRLDELGRDHRRRRLKKTPGARQVLLVSIATLDALREQSAGGDSPVWRKRCRTHRPAAVRREPRLLDRGRGGRRRSARVRHLL